MTKTTVSFAALLAILTAGPALALERWVHVLNDGNARIWSVQMSHIDKPDWGPDLLGTYAIPSGTQATLEPADPNGYCRFDVKLTYETGQEVKLWDINLCEAVEIRSNDSGYASVR